ncbi:hypothetical protein VTJ49DRAFT_4964 [Mycothermus thermophilus]|uniref:Zn(2)-C6 fungal-type domain-containing protein n=1 Tax=Humicola insolens TaxID=85995 RepID=A0ABR3VR26_HUMIN
MVYCGKPSKGCQMCRQRRIKCDETKPVCNQCIKARRQCPGYRDEFDLILRNENQAAKRRALKLSAPRRRATNSSTASSSSSSGSGSGAEKVAQRPLTTANLSTSSFSSSPPSSSSSSSSSPSSSRSPTLSSSSSSSSSSSPNTTPSPKVPSSTPDYYYHYHHQQQQRQIQRRPSPPADLLGLGLGPTPIHIPPETLAPSHFVANFVLTPRPDGSRGFLDYLLPLLTPNANTNTNPRTGPGPGPDNAHLWHAFQACALASLGNRPGYYHSGAGRGINGGREAGGGGGGGGGEVGPPPAIGPHGVSAQDAASAKGILGKAFAEYSKALRATQAALVHPERWKSDGVLAAVLLLGMFENITAKQIGNLAWGSHVEGAIQIVKARGRSQFRTMLGRQLFIAVRTQLIIHSLTSATPPVMGPEWWTDEVAIDSNATACQHLALQAGQLRAEITRALAALPRTPEAIEFVRGLMHRAEALDAQIQAWMDNLPESWQYRTVYWHMPNPNSRNPHDQDPARAEVFPGGRVDVYGDLWLASVWNQARTTRLALWSLAVRCAAWVCSPEDYRTTPQYAAAAKTCQEMIVDILASVPYNLGWRQGGKGKGVLGQDLPSSSSSGGLGGPFLDGAGEYGMMALAAYFVSWPLSCTLTQDFATDAQRAYARGRLRYIGDVVGIRYTHILSQLGQLQFRVPSMLIRHDGLMANPQQMPYNFEKMLSAARTTCPLPEGHAVGRDQGMLRERAYQGQTAAGRQIEV